MRALGGARGRAADPAGAVAAVGTAGDRVAKRLSPVAPVPVTVPLPGAA